jgi:RNA polymerase primary sigma factor
MTVSRTVARSASLEPVDNESVTGLAGGGSPAGVSGLFRLTAPREPDWHTDTPGARRSEPVDPHETVSALTLYMREIGQFKLLSREEEVALARRVRAGDEAAREEMIKSNLRLVVKIARDFDGLGLPLLDLISEGNIGLMKAVDRYEPAKGAKLSVYASYWIKQRICRALSNLARTIRVPVYAQDQLQIVQAASLRLQEQLGRDPTNDEITQEVGLPAGRVQRVREALQAPISLDEPLDDQRRESVAETVADEHATTPDEALAQATGMQRLWQFIAQLSTREQIILRARFGLEGGEESTLNDISQQLGLVRERVRQIQNTALAKLRKKFQQPECPLRAA